MRDENKEIENTKSVSLVLAFVGLFLFVTFFVSQFIMYGITYRNFDFLQYSLSISIIGLIGLNFARIKKIEQRLENA